MSLAVRLVAYVAVLALSIAGAVQAFLFVVGPTGERARTASTTDAVRARGAVDEYSTPAGRQPTWIAPTSKYDFPQQPVQDRKVRKTQRPPNLPTSIAERARNSFAQEESPQEPVYFSEPYRGH
jgi:hypothetical protein